MDKKACSSKNCKQTNPQSLSYFSRNRSHKDGYDNQCKVCTATYKKLWNVKNKKEISDQNKQWHLNNHEYDKIYRLRNNAKRVDGNRRWRFLNPDRANQYQRNRRARKRNAKGSFTFQEWRNLKQKYNYMCLCCKKKEPEVRLTVDHVVPLLYGGSNYISNIQPLCRSCNAKKHIKNIDYRKVKVE